MHCLTTFPDPPRQYGPVPFWFLNERLEPKRLEWQLREMHEKHVYGAVMHARPGLLTPYLSDEWFSMIGHIVSTAEKLGMFTWIYDEYPWHSGMAEWRVPKLHPDFHIRALDYVERLVDGPQLLQWHVGEELPDEARAIVAVVQTPVWQERLLGPGRVVSAAYRAGTLRLEVPQGRHHIAVYFERLSYNPYGDKFGCFPVTDLMHAQAVEAFLELTHHEYQRRFAAHMGSTIAAVFTDEPPAATPGWSRQFLPEFRRRKGYDLCPYLGFLWHPGDELAARVRLDYHDVLGALYEERFFGTIEEWAEKVNIASTGHLLLEETLLFHARFMGDYFRAMRRLHIPGIDYIFPGRIPPVVPKMAASVANLYGKERVMSECFALTGWDFTFEHMKWMTDWQLVHGVNLLVPHAFFYAISEDEPIPPVPDNLGFRWYDCPPSMFFQQPYWDYYGTYADYLRRACYLMSQGEHFCEVALYYPIETVQADFLPTKDYCNLHAFQVPGTWMTADYLWDGPPAAQTDAHFRAAGDELRLNGLDYDVVDDDSLRTAEIEDGTMVVRRRRRYKALILPRTEWISLEVYRLVELFQQQGGMVMATGCVPSRATEGSQYDSEVRAISARLFPRAGSGAHRSGLLPRPGEQLVAHLRAASLGDFSAGSPHVFASHRIIEGADVYFLVHHHHQESGPVPVTLRGSGCPLILDPLGGSMHSVQGASHDGGQVTFCLDFAPYESLFVVLGPWERTAAREHVARTPASWRVALEIGGPWQVVLDTGDRSPERVRDLPPLPDPASLPREHAWQQLAPWEERGLLAFSGAATYTTTFSWGQEPCEAASLDLGEVGVAAEVFLNDQKLGVGLWRPYRFATGRALQSGQNHLRVRVANTLANSIQASYGSPEAPSARPTHFARFAPGRLRSGLIGPVRVLLPATEGSR